MFISGVGFTTHTTSSMLDVRRLKMDNSVVHIYISLLRSLHYLLERIWVFLSNVLSEPINKQSLYYIESSLSTHILKSCVCLERQFEVDRWLCNRHIQTAMTYLVEACAGEDLLIKREYLQVTDGGTISLDWLKHQRYSNGNYIRTKSPTKRVLIIIPGLLHTQSEYKSLAASALTLGYKVGVFNRRGKNGTPLTTSKIMNPGDPADFRHTIKYIRARYPLYKRTVVSTTYGSVLLMSYLGEYGSSSYISAAVCVSPWYTASNINDNMAWFYDQIIKCTTQLWLTKYYTFLKQSGVRTQQIFSARTTKELCEITASALYKCSDLETFEDNNSPLRDADDISTPLLCISSLDDPLISRDLIPFELFKVNLNLMLVVTSHGGHGGYFNRKYQRYKWTDCVAMEYISAVLDFLQVHNS